MIRKIICIIIPCLIFNINIQGQHLSEISTFENLFEVKIEKPDYSFVKNSSNEIEQILSLSFLFYKSFLSSQDAVSCTFHPSCSVYALQSIQEQGLFWGVLNAIDRLTRCNGFSPEKYGIHEETHLLHDPVK